PFRIEEMGIRRKSERRSGVILALILVFGAGGSGRAAENASAPADAGPVPAPSPVPLRDFYDDVGRDFTLRSIGQVQVPNMRGDVQVQGWALDKVRVRAKRHVRAASPTEAKRLLSAVDFRYSAGRDNIELSAEYGRGLDIQERLHERMHPRTS